jgi:NRAMP (natural resistance-associated macrophage protein)-like metal ion transporter
MFLGVKKFFRSLGPGVIAGAADDDPSGIATYSQAGARFGYGLLWISALTLPFVTAVQEACARIGAATGKGLARIIKENYSRKVLYAAVALVVLANTVNIGADIGALGAAAGLILPVSFPALVLGFTALILLLEIFITYRSYARFLKWLTLALLAYPLTALLINAPWGEIVRATFFPRVELSFAFLFMITGIFGTTISPYMFFWEASEEVEEERSRRMMHGGKPEITKEFMRFLRVDNFIGMFLSALAAWSVIVVAGTVFHEAGIFNLRSAADAAVALEPLVQNFPNAGFLAKLVFSVGILGLGLLAVPVLSASASYALSEAFSWREGLNLKFRRAHGFYGVITVATLIGLAINFLGIDPIDALVFASVLNGVIAVPLLFLIAKISADRNIMGEWRSGPLSRALVWMTFGIMSAATLSMLWALLR